MAEAAAKTVLDKISQGHLECPICCCRFKDPKMLDCLHSFCLNCLEEIMSKQNSETEKITCPVCRSETQVPDKGLLNLSSSFFLSSLVDEVKQQETLLGKVSRPTATCDCGEDQKATWRCLDCSDNLCQKCREAHVRVKYTKNHQIVSFEDWHKSIIPGPKADHVKPINRMCTNHTDQALCFYCDTCDTFICTVCVAIDHRSAEHSYKKIDDSVRSFRRHVDDALLQFEKCKLRVKSTINSIKHARNRLQNKLAQARSDISAKVEAEIAKIRNKAKVLTEKVDKIGQERDSEYKKALMHNCDQMDRADQIVTAVNNLMRQADDFELLELKAKVMNNLEFQKELKCEPAKLDMAFIGVKCQDVVGNKDLGEVRISEKWQLKEEFGEEGSGVGEFQFARGVACFSNGDMVVCDTHLKRVSLFDANGRYGTSIAQGSDSNQLEAPFAVAVNCDDLLFVADLNKVKVFDTELQFVREFTPSVEEGLSEGDLSYIAVDKQRVAVAHPGRKVISVHNLDGSLIASASNIMVRIFIEMSNKELLFFTNYVEKRLLCIDFRGNEVFNVTPLLKGKPAKPTGVLCDDDDGSIYVAVHSESGEFGDSDEVQHYDSNGAFIKTVLQGLDFPLGMAFTPAGDVVVAEKLSVKIFERM